MTGSGGERVGAEMLIASGRVLFGQHCAACHALGQEGFGPPLGGITDILTKDELVERIREPAKIIESGDARAAALLARYKVAMPPFAQLEDAEIDALLAYIDRESKEQKLSPLAIDSKNVATAQVRWSPPVEKSTIAIELEEVVQIPRLPGRTAYKGITLLRADPREAGALLVDELMGVLYRVENREVGVFLDVRDFFPEFLCDPGVASGLGSFALHPDFVRNGRFYTLHSENFRGSPAVNASDIPADVPEWDTPPLEWIVTEWQLADPSAETFAGTRREVLRFVTPTTGHAGQEIAFAPATPDDVDRGKLYICIGDGGSGNLGRPDMAGHPRTFSAQFSASTRLERTGPMGAMEFRPTIRLRRATTQPFGKKSGPMVSGIRIGSVGISRTANACLRWISARRTSRK